MKKKIFFVRHGETVLNENGFVHDYHNISPLSQIGVRHIERLGESLQNENIEFIYHSPAVRATQSARILANILDLKDLFADYRLEERNWGEWGGKKWEEIAEKLGVMNITERYQFIPPNGESWENFEKRLLEFWQDLQLNQYQNIAIVTHMGSIRALLPLILSQPREKSFDYSFANASITQLENDGDRYKIIKMNDISHL